MPCCAAGAFTASWGYKGFLTKLSLSYLLICSPQQSSSLEVKLLLTHGHKGTFVGGRPEPSCFQPGPQEEKLPFRGIVLPPFKPAGPLLLFCMSLFVSLAPALCGFLMALLGDNSSQPDRRFQHHTGTVLASCGARGLEGWLLSCVLTSAVFLGFILKGMDCIPSKQLLWGSVV